jgi:hypothetical protein
MPNAAGKDCEREPMGACKLVSRARPTIRKHSTAEGVIAEPMKRSPSNFFSGDLFDGVLVEPKNVVIVCTTP